MLFSRILSLPHIIPVLSVIININFYLTRLWSLNKCSSLTVSALYLTWNSGSGSSLKTKSSFTSPVKNTSAYSDNWVAGFYLATVCWMVAMAIKQAILQRPHSEQSKTSGFCNLVPCFLHSPPPPFFLSRGIRCKWGFSFSYLFVPSEAEDW